MTKQMISDACIDAFLDVVPDLMHIIRIELRANRSKGLSVPQFRAMVLLSKNEGVSLSDVADYLGQSAAGTSAVIDGLIERGFVSRKEEESDRRKIVLTLRAAGNKNLDYTKQATHRNLASTFEKLSPAQCKCIIDALTSLRDLFAL
jgi:DNA-binding MarR family transcriptional regulator